MSITDATDDTKNESTVCGTTTNKDHQPTSGTEDTKKAASKPADNILPPCLDMVGVTLDHNSSGEDLESMALGCQGGLSKLGSAMELSNFTTAAPSSNFAKTADSFDAMKDQKRGVVPLMQQGHTTTNLLSLDDGDIGGLGLELGLPSGLPNIAALNIGEYNLQDIINEVGKDWNTGYEAKLRFEVTHTPKKEGHGVCGGAHAGTIDWETIQKRFPAGFSAKLKHRWNDLNNPSTKEKGSDVWSTVDDVTLILAGKNYDGKTQGKWNTLAKGFPGRTGLDCKRRFYNIERTLNNVRAGTYSEKTGPVFAAAAYLRLTKKPVPPPKEKKKPSAAKKRGPKTKKKAPAAKTGNSSKKQKKTSAPKSKKQKSSDPEMLPMLDPFGSVGGAPQPILALPSISVGVVDQSTNDGQEKEESGMVAI